MGSSAAPPASRRSNRTDSISCGSGTNAGGGSSAGGGGRSNVGRRCGGGSRASTLTSEGCGVWRGGVERRGGGIGGPRGGPPPPEGGNPTRGHGAWEGAGG